MSTNPPLGTHASARDIVETIALALSRGYTHAEILAPDSPIRERIVAEAAAPLVAAEVQPDHDAGLLLLQDGREAWAGSGPAQGLWESLASFCRAQYMTTDQQQGMHAIEQAVLGRPMPWNVPDPKA